MASEMNARGIAVAIVSAIGLGTLAILAKLGLGLGMVPSEIIQYRFGFGALLLFAWLGATNPSFLRIRPQAIAKAAFLGLCIYPVQSYAFVKALAYIPASTTSLIFYLYPLVTTLLAVAVFRLRPGRMVWAAMLVIIVGCGLIFHDAFAQELDVRGIGYALVCMFFFSVYLTVIQFFSQKDEARRLGPWVILSMAVLFTILHPPLKLFSYGYEGLAVAVALGLVPTALAVSLLYMAVGEMGSAFTAIFSTIEPVATVGLAALVLGEEVNLIQLGGMSCIIIGIIMPNVGLLRERARLRAGKIGKGERSGA